MRRQFAIFLLAAFLLLPNAAARAQAAPVLPETTAQKARIDGFAHYMTDTSEFKHIEPSGAVPEIILRNGIAPYVEDWYGTFQRARMAGTDGGFALSEKSPVGVTSPDSTYGETMNGFYTYCFKYKDLVVKAKEISDRAMIATTSPFADAEKQKKLSEIVGGLAVIAQNVMTFPSPLDPDSSGAKVCAKLVSNIYYAFRHPGGTNTSFACVANLVLNPSREPANDSGVCARRNDSNLNFGELPGCTAGANCKFQIAPCNQNGCTYYNFKPSRATMDSSLKSFDDLLNAQDKKLAEVAGELVAKGMDAAKLGSELQARGTALSLPLPLSDITIPDLIGRILNTLLGIVGAVALLLFTWGGIRWMTAAGNQDQIGKAKSTITWAAIGLVAIFSAYAILKLLIDTFRS